MFQKFALKSLTILSALVALLVQVGPAFGLSFTADDASVFTENLDTIITSVSALGAMVGRVRAKSTITFKPGKTG